MGRRPPILAAESTPDDGTGDIDLHGDSKQIWQDLAKIFGLDCVFDGDYQPTGPMRFRLKSVDYRVAMRGLEAATSTFMIPITSKVFMVAKDTPQKRTGAATARRGVDSAAG